MLIRNATSSDIAPLIRFGYLIHAESKFSTLSFDAEKVQQTLESITESKNGTHCCFIAENSEKELIGVFIGCMEEYFFSRSLMAHSILIYVHPKWRGSSAAVKFIHAFRKWAMNRKALEVCIGVASGVTIGRTDRFLKRLGFSVTGGNYSMVIRDQQGSERRAS
jgi:Acetyltransferase (GNAT) family